MSGGLILAACLLALYAPVLADTVTTWWTSESASHGFLIPLIAAYLVWNRRHRLLAASRPWRWGLAVVAFGLLLYPAGLFAVVEFLPQVSFLVVLGGLMLYFHGVEAAKAVAFPYAFLYFMVPWPDTLVEFISFPMQLFSAKFAAMLTGLAGVPVSRDGVDIHLSNYTFSVGVPCSGMKSLVALLALGALVAYLLQGPRWKRWVLFGASMPLAMLANVVRIVCILGIARIWGAKAAEGFFHGFSGGAVFLFATLGLVATGRALGLTYGHRAPGQPTGAAPVQGGAGGAGESPDASAPGARGMAVTRSLRGYAAPLALLLATAGLVAVSRVEAGGGAPTAPDFSTVPMQMGEWEGEDRGPLDETSQEILQPDAYMGRIYANADGYPVDVSVVFGHQKETFHSPGFCLLGGGWNIIRKTQRAVDCDADGQAVLANEFLLQREGEQRVVLYWYVSRGETTPSWVVLQYRLLRNRVLKRPRGGALVRVTAPVGGSAEVAEQIAEDLMRELYPGLREAMAL